MKKLISIILVFGILNITFSACTSTKLISIDEASQMQQSKKYLILHSTSKTFMLINYEFADNKLKGELTKFSKMNGYNIHVYTPVNYEVKVDENSRINVELNKSDITKVTYSKSKPGATALLVVGGVLGIIVVAGAITTNNMTVDLSGL